MRWGDWARDQGDRGEGGGRQAKEKRKSEISKEAMR